jgi:type VI secretion system protein ImpG
VIKDPRFLRYYEQELRFVRDMAGEFASEHARVANRFGLDADSCADPHVEWLLDGFAFLAARVQQKLDGDYAVFTQHLLEMIYPDYLAPTPATGIAALELAPDAPPLEGGFTIPQGSRLQTSVVPGEASRCTFTTAHAVTVWPIEIAEARYLAPAALAAMGISGGARAGILFRLRSRNAIAMSDLALDRLALHLSSRDRAAHLLYEALIGHCVGITGLLGGKPGGTMTLDGGVSRLGFGDDEALLPQSPRGFSGFRLLREYFTLPERFLFVGIDGLRPLIRRAAGNETDFVVLLDRYDSALDSAVTKDQFALFATPVINLFPRRAKPILIEPYDDQHHVIVDRSRPLDHEVYSITRVAGYGTDGQEVCSFTPFYAVSGRDPAGSPGYYTIERRPRLLSERERRSSSARSSYLGSEIWIELCDATGGKLRQEVKRLDVDALVSNRDLPLHLQPGDLQLSIEAGGPVSGARMIGGLTRPKPSPAAVEPEGGGIWGDIAWRLIGHLALNYHSLVDSTDGSGAGALRGLLELYAGAAEPQIARHVDAVRGVMSRAVTARLPGGAPITFGRGLEVTLDLAEASMQDGSAFLLGGVLETFFRRYVTLNSFVETVLKTNERGEIMRWQSQLGSRHLA